MKNFIIGAIILTSSSLANAVPNHWDKFDKQGYKVYKIDDTKGRILRIHCNYAASDNQDNGVYLTINNKDYPNPSSPYPLRFMINNSIDMEVSRNTKSKSESKKWYEFTLAITKAKTIDIFIENEIISTIYPKNPKALKDLVQCKSMYDRPKIGV